MSDEPSDLMSIVVAALAERGWQHSVRGEGWRTALVQGPHTSYELQFRADDAMQLLVTYCVLPMRVPPALRGAMCETIARANHGLLLGAFELDLSDGELRFKNSVDVEGSALVPLMVHNMIAASLFACDRYYPAIAKVLYAGARPADAVAEVEVSPEDAQAADIADAPDAPDAPDAAAPVSAEVDALLRALGVPPGDGDEAAARLAAEQAEGEGEGAAPPPAAEGTAEGRSRDPAVLAPPIPDCYVVGDARLLAGEYPGDRTDRAARDKLARLLDAGVTYFLDLTGEGELRPYAPLLAEVAGGRAVRHVRLPVRDMDVPAVPRMAEILDAIDAALEDGHTVYVHCWGGVGRTGTAVACHLVRRGHDADAALAEVGRLFATMSAGKRRRHPEGSPQTAAQRAFVRAWEAEERGRRPARGRVAVRDGTARRDREHFRGCLLGGAVGDALGAPVEFASLAEIRARYGAAGITDLDVAYGRVGAVTDDTQMTMFTAEGLLRAKARAMERGLCDPVAVVRHAYLRWLRTQDPRSPEPPFLAEAPGWLIGVRALHTSRAPGRTCLSALYDERTGSTEAPLNDSKGCGGVMRVAPVALLAPGDPFADAAAFAALTHGHPTGYLAAGTLAELLRHVLAGADLEHALYEALARLARERGHEETTAALTKALFAWREGGAPTAERLEQLGQGWVAEEALAMAVYAALAGGDDFGAGVRLAVNHSGDSDSTGAIAGHLLGARLGVTAVPRRWLQRLELRAELETLADDLLVGWRDGEAWRRRYPGC